MGKNLVSNTRNKRQNHCRLLSAERGVARARGTGTGRPFVVKLKIVRIVKTTAALVAIVFFVIYNYLYEYYSRINPPLPSPSSGNVIPLNNHGSIVYLDPAQNGFMKLMLYGSIGLFCLAVILDVMQRHAKK